MQDEKCHPELVDVYTRDNNWCYFGGGKHRTHYQKNPRRHHYNYFMLAWRDHFRYQPYIAIQERCVCNTKIQQQCYIIQRDTKEVIIVGNCCIEKFQLKGRTCGICHAIHRNTSDNYCNDCRIKNKAEEKEKEIKKTQCIVEGCLRIKHRWNGKYMPRCKCCWYKDRNK